MLRILYASCLGLSPGVLAQFTLEMKCPPQLKIAKKSLKIYFRVQGH